MSDLFASSALDAPFAMMCKGQALSGACQAASAYGIRTALVTSCVFFVWGCYGLREGTGAKWAKSLFGISILYLVLLFAVLAIDP